MRIVGADECSINACAQFEYKGWTVSMSTIFIKDRVEVWAYNDLCELKRNTVEDAIKFIDEMES